MNRDIIDIITSLATIVALITLSYQIYVRHKDEKIKQASFVSCWMIEDEKKTIVRISNYSLNPIYDVVVSVDDIQGSSLVKGDDNCKLYYSARAL